jgi:multicomponent Na+:H+ antiporter subunit B
VIRPFDSLMLRVLLGPLTACLQLFAVYVVLHGHYSPGGGFQGGVLLGAAMVLPMLVYGRRRGFLILSERGAAVLAVAGVFIFAAIGLYSLVMGRPFLDYSALPVPWVETPQRRSLGILGIEIGVAIAVAGVVVSIFYSLASEDEEA